MRRIRTGCVLAASSMEECKRACATYPTGGRDGDLSGDTVQCRTTHAQAAAQGREHCAHARPAGGGACE